MYNISSVRKTYLVLSNNLKVNLIDNNIDKNHLMKHLTEFFKTSLTPKNNKRGTVCRGQVPVETNRPSKKIECRADKGILTLLYAAYFH